MDAERSMRTIGAVVGAGVALPAIVLVTAADTADDTTTVAHGLARFFASGAYRTAYAQFGTVRSAEPAPAAAYASLDLDTLLGNAADADAETTARLRAAYDVVLVDVPVLLDDRRALRLARSVDGVLVALRAGRRVSPSDTETATLLRTLGAVRLGVVTTRQRPPVAAVEAPAAAAAFEPRSAFSRA